MLPLKQRPPLKPLAIIRLFFPIFLLNDVACIKTAHTLNITG